MPTVVLNAALSLLSDRSLSVRGPDAVAAIAPMFNEESGAPRAIVSLLEQSEPLDELLISINGGSDNTPKVVRELLAQRGFELVDHQPIPGLRAELENWSNPESATKLTVVDHVWPVSKADSINLLIAEGLVAARRVLIVDGDTEFDSGFLSALKDNFYRLRFAALDRGADGARRYGYLLEDVALQSGAVRSRLSRHDGPQAAFIAAGRNAEYALSSVLRTGQCRRFSNGATFGRSRLFTVVGCGFVARRDALPMPSDTRTEDHDFTLVVQNGAEQQSIVSAATLDARGFRVLSGGRERSFSAHLGATATVLARKSAAARFVPDAAMFTDDPPHFGGLLRQVERWNGGSLENALKRLAPRGERAPLKANVLFALIAAQFENFVGLLLLLSLPVLLGLQYGLPGARTPIANFALWLGLDLIVTSLLVLSGAVRLLTGRGKKQGRWSAVKLTAKGVLPLLILRSLSAIAYLTAGTRVLPAYLRPRLLRHSARPQPGPAAATAPQHALRPTLTWDRPSSRAQPKAHHRALAVSGALAVTFLALFSGATTLTKRNADQRNPAWHHTFVAARLEQDDHDELPLQASAGRQTHAPTSSSAPILIAATVREAHAEARVATTANEAAYQTGAAAESTGLCPAAALPNPATNRRTLYGGSDDGGSQIGGAGHVPADTPEARAPLSPWGLLILARLAPLLSDLEGAATAYDLDADLLLQVLLNESFLDPLAVGPTGDLGLAQVTSDALTLIHSISTEPDSPWRNELLFAGAFSVYDPGFSLCAGAAKLAWAVAQPNANDDEVAYALYINPFRGAVDGKVAKTHLEPVAAMVALRPLVELLGATVSSYRHDPADVSVAERLLLDVAQRVESGSRDVREAYAEVAELVAQLQIDDRQFYRAVRDDLYGSGSLLDGSVGFVAQPQ